MSTRRVIDAIGANMALRIGSFVMSMLLTRLSTPSMRGMGFQADVVVNTVGFIAREALRCIYAAYPPIIMKHSEKSRRQKAVLGLLCLSSLAVPFAMIALLSLEALGAFLPIPSFSRLAFVSESPNSIPIVMWLGGLLVEWASEPLVAMVIATHEFKARVVAEALALAASKGVAVGALALIPTVAAQPSYLVGLQQFVFGVVTAVVLWYSVYRRSANAKGKETADDQQLSLFEIQSLSRGVFPPPSLGVLLLTAKEELFFHLASWQSYFNETVLRLVLTEGEKYILASYVTMSGQGVFDVVNTLGSLVARLIFRVWEEGSFNVWKGTIASADEKERVRRASAHETNIVDLNDDLASAHYITCIRDECLPSLQALVRICFYIGSLTMLLAQPLPRFALVLIFSNKWAGDEATSVLRLFCVYIPLMGLNGLLEAFLRATARRSVFATMQKMMIVTSVISIGITLFFVRFLAYGVVGLMTASVLNVTFRTIVNLTLLSTYARGAWRSILQIKAFLPLVSIVAVVNVAIALSGGWEVEARVGLKTLVSAIAIGLGALAVVGPIAYRIEKKSGNSIVLRR